MSDDEERTPRRRWLRPAARLSIELRVAPIYWSYAGINVVMGIFLMLAPQEWYGPSWHFFPQLPHDGFGMGLSCFGVGVIQHLVLWRRPTAFLLSVVFFLSAFIYWTAGCILAAEGILGHQGLMEAPFMLVIALFTIVHSASLMAYHREAVRTGEQAPDGEPFLKPAPISTSGVRDDR